MGKSICQRPENIRETASGTVVPRDTRARGILGKRNPNHVKLEEDEIERRRIHHLNVDLSLRLPSRNWFAGKFPASATWEVLLSADEQYQVAAVHLEGKPVDFAGRQCSIPSLRGPLTVLSRDGQKRAVPLFEDEPLIFKLRKDWSGEGRKIARITNGFFIVIAPDRWKRTGHVPVEPHDCVDLEFRAHYFHRDTSASDDGVGGFQEWNGSLVATGIELGGRHICDDSDDEGLFVGDAPTLEPSPEIQWARVGEETGNGWGQNFRPHEQPLPDVLAGREGRFFLRVYNAEVRMLDSMTFRYMRDLRQIQVDGNEYAQDTMLAPTPRGYLATKVCFIGANGFTLFPELPPRALQYITSSGAIEVPPRPDADRISCRIASDNCTINIVLDLPRIWWRLEDGGSDPGAWRDTQLVMTRQEFKKRAYADDTLSLLSRRQTSVRAGFDDEVGAPYNRNVDECRIAIPLVHFVDHQQIDQKQNDDRHFNIEVADKTIPLIRISADPNPEIVSFTAKPAANSAGEEVVLAWATRNAQDARVAIDPDLGEVKSDGTCTVRPAKTTRYTLTLAVSDANETSRSVTVTIDTPSGPGGKRSAAVMSHGGRWRNGKGFSVGELRAAGLMVTEAATRSIPVDRRRRTTHRANVEAIRSMLDD